MCSSLGHASQCDLSFGCSLLDKDATGTNGSSCNLAEKLRTSDGPDGTVLYCSDGSDAGGRQWIGEVVCAFDHSGIETIGGRSATDGTLEFKRIPSKVEGD